MLINTAEGFERKEELVVVERHKRRRERKVIWGLLLRCKLIRVGVKRINLKMNNENNENN